MLPEAGSSLYHTAVKLAARFGNKKARKWVEGRKQIPEILTEIVRKRQADQPLIWLHAASLGEFEQGTPVFEAIRAEKPNAFMVLTFFSPSGYEARKHYPTADAVLYLPEDNKAAVSNWLEQLRPDLAIFVKYEFWPHHLKALKKAGVPTVLIAGAFRAGQAFFKWYGSEWRALLSCFDKLIVQTESDADLLLTAGISADKIAVAGDPRADRVLQIADTDYSNDILSDFSANHKVLMAGSVWANDVAMLLELLAELPENWRIIMAPHQLKEAELENWTAASNGVRYTQLQSGKAQLKKDTQVLILDTIGILSKSYRYADLAYVGGGFGSSIHNTLEPMAYGLPVIFGPAYHKFPEAVATVKNGGSFSVSSGKDLIKKFHELDEATAFSQAAKAIKAYTQASKGATERTMKALPLKV